MSIANPGFGAVTLRDLQNAHQPGTIQRTVLDAISKKNAVMDDLTFYEASDGDRDVTEMVTGLPKAQFFVLGEGKNPSAGSRQTKSFMPARAYVMLSILRDKYLQMAEKGKEEDYLRKEIDLQAGALGTLLVESFLYGDRATQKKGINGLAKFYSKFGNGLGNDMDPFKRVFNGCTTTSATVSSTQNRSIFCVGFSDKGIKPFYPEGAKDGGIGFGPKEMDDVAREDKVNGGTVHWLERELTWHNGLAVVDPRHCTRIANVKKDKILTDDAYPQHLLSCLMMASDMCRAENKAFHMERDMWTFIKVMLTRMTMANAFTQKDMMERPTEFLFGVPVRLNESMDIDETAVVQAT